MKNFIVVVLILGLSSTSFGQARANWTLVHERTATWCPLCGGWGWTFKDQVLNEFADDNVIFTAVHHSGDLTNPDAVTFGNNFGGSGQPIFFVDGVDIRVNNSNRTQKLEETQLELEFKEFAEVLAGIELNSTIDEFTQELNVEAEVEFYTSIPDNVSYYLGLYLLEDVMNAQANRTGMQLHKNVLRKSILPQVFDNSIKTGSVEAGDKFNFQASLGDLTADPENYKVLAVIWTKPQDKYLFFNANIDQPDVINTSSVHDVLSIPFTVFQAESGSIVLNFEAPVIEEGQITLTDLSGKVLVTSDLNANGSLTHQLTASYRRGIHIVTVRQGMKQSANKIFLY